MQPRLRHLVLDLAGHELMLEVQASMLEHDDVRRQRAPVGAGQPADAVGNGAGQIARDRLGDGVAQNDAAAWGQFVELYAPPVYACARRQGLQDADAADLTQDVLRAVSGAFRRGDYDVARGRFRAWLFTVVRNRLRDFFARHEPQLQGEILLGSIGWASREGPVPQ